MKNLKAVKKRLLGLVSLSFFACLTPVTAQDTCTVNSECIDALAFTISGPGQGQSNLELSGCNLYSSPDPMIQNCLMGDFPTVWYRFTIESSADIMSVVIKSDDFDMPVISLFESDDVTCNTLEPILLTSSNLSCVIGSDGMAKVVGIPISKNKIYYLAVSSYLSIGGDFSIHLRALAGGGSCVQQQGLEITARENGGPLEGPFDPNEKVSICLNVYEFSGVNNGCQWFQGLVPVFGNGWDPSSFDAQGQPKDATVNGLPIGEPGNGVYSLAQWDWFTDVDYHHENDDLTIGDFDSNGRKEMCNSFYDPDCPMGGMKEACCGPCWDKTPGDTLAGGWFAYGINGSCSDPGPPIRVDWGDGNTCGSGMGPWQFCFDLTTRDIPDCGVDSTRRDLSIGYFTFADGETGAWSGNSSVCIRDVPLQLSLEAKCGRVTFLDPEILPPLESGDTLRYEIEEQDIQRWEWNISPFWAVPYFQNTGDNGFEIKAPLQNSIGDTVDVTGIFIGHYGPNFMGANDKLVKKIKFKVISETSTSVTPGNLFSSGNQIKVYPMPVPDAAILEWSFEVKKEALITIFDAHGQNVMQTTVIPGSDRQQKVSTNHLSPGIYYLSFSNSDFRHVTKMVKL